MGISDVLVIVKMKNNRILIRMEKEGLYSVSDLIKRMGIEPCSPAAESIKRLVNMEEPAATTGNLYSEAAMQLADFFNVSPRTLFGDGKCFSGKWGARRGYFGKAMRIQVTP